MLASFAGARIHDVHTIEITYPKVFSYSCQSFSGGAKSLPMATGGHDEFLPVPASSERGLVDPRKSNGRGAPGLKLKSFCGIIEADDKSTFPRWIRNNEKKG